MFGFCICKQHFQLNLPQHAFRYRHFACSASCIQLFSLCSNLLPYAICVIDWTLITVISNVTSRQFLWSHFISVFFSKSDELCGKRLTLHAAVCLRAVSFITGVTMHWSRICVGAGLTIQIKYGLPYCVTCPSMSTDPGSLNLAKPSTRVVGSRDPHELGLQKVCWSHKVEKQNICS